MADNDVVIAQISKFCEQTILPFLETNASSIEYPSGIIEKMGRLGLFGINIPEEYGGSKISISLNLEINRIFSQYWLAIPALYGTHLRANQYFLSLATVAQRREFLPAMATGRTIAAHAFHEKGIKSPTEFRTNIGLNNGKYVLNGQKEWVTNATNADFLIVVARKDVEVTDHAKPEAAALIVDPTAKGVRVTTEHTRSGLHGVSLNRVTFDNVEIRPELFIGGLSASADDFVSDFRPISSLNFSARCVGVAESIIGQVEPHLLITERDSISAAVIAHKWSELKMLMESIRSYFYRSVELNRQGLLNKSDAYRTKVYCSSTLQTLVSKARMLSGGSGYAGDDHRLIRQLNDAGSLELIDTPNDVLLTWSGADDLGIER